MGGPLSLSPLSLPPSSPSSTLGFGLTTTTTATATCVNRCSCPPRVYSMVGPKRDGERVVPCFVAERLKRSPRSSPFAVYHVLSLSPFLPLSASDSRTVGSPLARCSEAETEMGGHFEWERKSGERCYVLQIHPSLPSHPLWDLLFAV